MNDDEVATERRREAAGWLAIAREDLRVADACLVLDPRARRMATYHCQQAAEKSLKGLLTAAGVGFRKTHDLDELADLGASPDPAIDQLLQSTRPMTVWAPHSGIRRWRTHQRRPRAITNCARRSRS